MLSKIIELPGGIPIYSYGLMIVTGFLLGLWVATRRARLAGVDPTLIFDLGFYGIITGMLGGKAFFLVENRSDFGWKIFNVFDGGLSGAGALYGVLGGVVLFFIFGAGTGRFQRLRRPSVRRRRFLIGLVLFLLVAALAGARADYVRDVNKQHQTQKDSSGTISQLDKVPYDTRIFTGFGSGFVFYGGVLTATLVILLTLKIRKVPILKVLDIIGPSLMIGLAFGRIGCQLNGCCFGDVCAPDSLLAITFPKHVDTDPGSSSESKTISPAYRTHGGHDDHATADPSLPERSLEVYPTGLFMSVNAFLLFWVLTWFGRKPRRAGSTVFLLGFLYPITRFLIEIFRGDPVAILYGLRISQWVSIGILAVIIPMWVVFLKKKQDATQEGASAQQSTQAG